MAIYTRTTTIDSGPTGDSVKQAVLDLDTDLTGIVAAYDVHDVATTNVHGFTGTKTGSGAMVGATSPTLVTPTLGIATATSINKVAITAPANGSTLAIADGKTLTASNTLTFTGTDSSSVAFSTGGTVVYSVTAGNGVSATNTAGALAFSLGAITPSSVNGITLSGGTNTFSATVGTASLDVAPAATVNIDKSLTVNGNYGTVIASEGQENTLTLNEGLTVGNGNSGTVTFSGASKTLTVEGNSTVNQDLTTDASPTFAAIKLTTGAASGKVLTSDADGDATWETVSGSFASTAETVIGTESAKYISPSASVAAGIRSNINNLKLVVNATANILDIFSKSGGADPDATNPIAVMIPDGNGGTMRTRAASFLSGTSAITMADGTDYWGRYAAGLIGYQGNFPTALSATYVKATSTHASADIYAPVKTSTLLTGNSTNNWFSNSAATNQRYQFVVPTAVAPSRIYYENYHDSGSDTDVGGQNFQLWGSNSADISDVTWKSDADMGTAGWTKITTASNAFEQHAASDAADPKYITITSTVAYTKFCFAISNNFGDATYLGMRRLELQTIEANPHAYLYAIWDATNSGIVWALGGFSGFTAVPTTTTATDADYFILETSSTYTRLATDYCVVVGKIAYKYETIKAPDYTIQTTAENAPMIIWNPKSDYHGKATLATTDATTSLRVDSSRASAVIKQTGMYLVNADVNAGCSGGDDQLYVRIRCGSSVYDSAVVKKKVYSHGNAFTNSVTKVSVTDVLYIKAGQTLHVGASLDGNNTRAIYGDDNFPGGTGICFTRID